MSPLRPRAGVSVVVPARNEERSLPSLLDALLAQSLQPDEVVVADGGSADDTLAVARGFGARGVRILELGPAYPGRGRNAGIEAAGNEWIALIDAGCVPDPGWLEHLLRARDAADRAVQVVFGDYDPVIRDEWSVAIGLAILPPRDVSGCRPPFIASSLVHRSAWQAAGGFPEHLRAAEDLLFFQRLESAGVRAVRSPEAIIRWEMAAGPGAVFRRLRLYSAHHLAAGLWRTWHGRVLAMDAAAIALAGACCLWPAAGAALLAAALARLLKTVASRRNSVPGLSSLGAFRPDRLVRAGFLLLVADAATWAGAVDFLRARGRP